jgi:hypothetical protein
LHQNTVPADFVFNKSLRTRLSARVIELLGKQTPVYVLVEGKQLPRPAVVTKFGANTSLDDRGRIVHDADVVCRPEVADTDMVGTDVVEVLVEVVSLRRSQRVRKQPARLDVDD